MVAELFSYGCVSKSGNSKFPIGAFFGRIQYDAWVFLQHLSRIWDKTCLEFVVCLVCPCEPDLDILRHKTCCGWWLNPHIPSSGRIICGPHQGTRFGSSYSHKDGNENFLGWTERFWFVIHEHCSKNLLWFHSTGCPLEHLSHVQRWLVDCWLVFH